MKLTRWKALQNLNNTNHPVLSKVKISNRCIKTFNKKRFSKFSNYCRAVFLKLAKSGAISYLRKSSW